MFDIGGAEVNHFAIWHDKAATLPPFQLTMSPSRRSKDSMAMNSAKQSDHAGAVRLHHRKVARLLCYSSFFQATSGCCRSFKLPHQLRSIHGTNPGFLQLYELVRPCGRRCAATGHSAKMENARISNIGYALRMQIEREFKIAAMRQALPWSGVNWTILFLQATSARTVQRFAPALAGRYSAQSREQWRYR